MTEPVDISLAMIFSFFEGVDRKGPGSEASTLKALSMLNDLPPRPRVVEFGCGTGVATLPLARSCDVTAVEIHQPFLDQLDAAAAKAGLADRIKTVQADMGDPPFPKGSFDVVWSEAAIYNVGFERGLRLWQPLLRPGGFVVVSEVVWLTPQPPAKAKAFWEAEYPSITTVDNNLDTLRAAGFEPIDHFILPPDDWRNYYAPLQAHLDDFRSKHADDAPAQTFAGNLQREIDLWKACGDSFGYCFFVAKAD